jgi:hypothetical protein
VTDIDPNINVKHAMNEIVGKWIYVILYLPTHLTTYLSTYLPIYLLQPLNVVEKQLLNELRRRRSYR